MTELTFSTRAPDPEALARHLVERYLQGSSFTELSREIGRSYGYVRRVLIDAGVKPRPRGGPRLGRRG